MCPRPAVRFNGRFLTGNNMHTKDLARALRAFAGIADFDRSQDLHRLAAFFDRGRNETVAARLKRAAPSEHYPLRLKQSLEALEAGLRLCGAIKPSGELAHIQILFSGRPNGSLEDFFSEISTPPRMTDITARRFKKADLNLAKNLSSNLAIAAGNTDSFRTRLAELESSTPAGTATWTLVANQFIGNRKIYRDRKTAVRAIQRHFEDFLLQHN